MTYSLDILITAVATVLSGGVTGLLTYVASRDSARISSLEDEVSRLRSIAVRALSEVEGYYAEETFLVDDLHGAGAAGGTNKIKARYRDMVMEAGFTRPSMTAVEARQKITDLSEKRT